MNEEDIVSNCRFLRKKILDVLIASGNGHLGGSMSSVEMITTLYCSEFFRLNPHSARRDKILIRGHVGPLRYPLFSELGWVSEGELTEYRRLGSSLQGHEDMDQVLGVDITPSGCLGNLLGYGVGAALVERRLAASSGTTPASVIVFLGDGEEQEGAVSEAARVAVTQNLQNILCVIDANGGQLSDRTELVEPNTDTCAIWRAYGWEVLEVDGHSVSELTSAYQYFASGRPAPLMVYARTEKGRGVDGHKDVPNGYHTLSSVPGKGAAKTEFLRRNRDKYDGERPSEFKFLKPDILAPNLNEGDKVELLPLANWKPENVDVRTLIESSDASLVSLCKQHPGRSFYVINSDTFTAKRRQTYDSLNNLEFLQCGIREQTMVALAHGVSVADANSFVVVDAAEPFLARCYDQLNALAQAKCKVLVLSCFSGLCGNENGSTHQPSFMSIALNAIPNILQLEPSEPGDVAACYQRAMKHDGPTVLRFHSAKHCDRPRDAILSDDPATHKLYEFLDSSSSSQRILLVTSGLLVREALEAAKELSTEFQTRVLEVIDTSNAVPIDILGDWCTSAATYVFYNGNPRSLDKALTPKLRIISRFGFEVGTSGRNDHLLRYFNLDAQGIIESVQASMALGAPPNA